MLMSERKEAWMRILVGIISGIVLALWKIPVIVLTILHWFYAVFSNKRSKAIAEFCNMWATSLYRYERYMYFATNTRPFPFSELGSLIEQVDFKNKNSK